MQPYWWAVAKRFTPEQIERRRALLPAVTYPDLPIAERRDDILAAIEANQVVVVAGETGSGKSTQLPKLCLDLGRGAAGFIGHTQPRRLAARSVAERVAEELHTSIGELVGYTVRFTDQVGPKTLVKLMTDGILLAELQRDKQLSRYDTIIIDEAHERSLNIDFLLGYLKQLLPRRPDLKVIITSATIDTDKFSSHFNEAPIIEVSGRTFPVDIRYRPLSDPDGDSPDGRGREPLDQNEAIVAAVKELSAEGAGDILTFLSGERDIREAAATLEGLKMRNLEVLPLYGRLSAAEQHRVFSDHPGRRVVLATNVAETSLTVPGVRYVIDTGTARISRFSNRTKVQRLPIEAISQASANQRSGRCGRVGPGIAIRLYEEEDYESRPEFTEPEIQRTNLASVILQMASLGLGSAEDFPFVDPPEKRSIRDGVMLLEELDAVNPENEGTKNWLTPLGRQLARLPLDPRFGRMVLEATDYGCLAEVMIITSGMSVIDVRERPSEKQQAADESHKRFDVDGSDFLSILELWRYIGERRSELTQNRFRRMCKQEFLNFNRIREWQDIHRQLERVAKDLDLPLNASPADPDNVHRSLLAGLLSQVGTLPPEKGGSAKASKSGKQAGKKPPAREYVGARNSRFVIARGSALGPGGASWVMAGELVETNRMWARRVARIRPEWIEKAADHLVRHSYGEPWWDIKQGAALANEKITLYGLPVVNQRRVQVGRLDPEMAREWFIHHALIEGEWEGAYGFIEHNAEILEEVRTLAARTRSSDASVDYERLYAFYDQHLDDTVVSAGSFNRWWKEKRKTGKSAGRLLDLTVDDLIDRADVAVDEQDYPQFWTVGELTLPLSYEYEPGSPRDGLVVNIPVASLRHLEPDAFAWNVPGVRRELVAETLRTMPKSVRKEFVPIPDTVAAIVDLLDDKRGFLEEVRRCLGDYSGVQVGPESFDLNRLPDHLRPTFRVFDETDATIAEGRDLDDVKAEVHGQVEADLAVTTHELEKSGETTWVFGTIPTTTTTTAAGAEVLVYPALFDEGETVGLSLLPSGDDQWASMWGATRRLLQLNLPGQAKTFRSLLTNATNLALLSSPYGSSVDWYNDVVAAAIEAAMRNGGGVPWNEADWDALVRSARDDISGLVTSIGRSSAEILVTVADIKERINELANPKMTTNLTDAGHHLDRLVYAGFVQGVGADRIDDVLRYVMAIDHRLEKLPSRIGVDTSQIKTCLTLESEAYRTIDAVPASAATEAIIWMLEEFRVSAFAQQVGTKGTVSEKRIRKALRDL